MNLFHQFFLSRQENANLITCRNLPCLLGFFFRRVKKTPSDSILWGFKIAIPHGFSGRKVTFSLPLSMESCLVTPVMLMKSSSPDFGFLSSIKNIFFLLRTLLNEKFLDNWFFFFYVGRWVYNSDNCCFSRPFFKYSKK